MLQDCYAAVKTGFSPYIMATTPVLSSSVVVTNTIYLFTPQPYHSFFNVIKRWGFIGVSQHPLFASQKLGAGWLLRGFAIFSCCSAQWVICPSRSDKQQQSAVQMVHSWEGGSGWSFHRALWAGWRVIIFVKLLSQLVIHLGMMISDWVKFGSFYWTRKSL